MCVWFLFFMKVLTVLYYPFLGESLQLLGYWLTGFSNWYEKKEEIFFSSYRLIAIRNNEVQMVWVPFSTKICK